MEQPKDEVSILPQLDMACGLDMHKDKIVAFASSKDGKVQELREFNTFTADLYALLAWLRGFGSPPHCLMESTGVYWVSLYTVLSEGGIAVTVANPTHIKQVPKRKTDRKDARWLCTLLLHGLVRPSFMADGVQEGLRTYCRNRLFYKRQQTKVFNRLVKILETANIKLRSVISNLHTETAMGIIRLLAQGVTDIPTLLGCLKGRAKKNRDRFTLALAGTLQPHQLTMMQMLLDDVDQCGRQIDRCNREVSAIISAHYSQVAECLDSVSGIGMGSAEVIISEIGTDMGRFPSADHLAAWAGTAPGNNESAGRRKSTSVKKGNKYLRMAMVAAAWGAVKMKDSYWAALFRSLRKRMKSQKAIMVIARKLLKVVYRVIKEKAMYKEKGLAHFNALQANRGLSNAPAA